MHASWRTNIKLSWYLPEQQIYSPYLLSVIWDDEPICYFLDKPFDTKVTSPQTVKMRNSHCGLYREALDPLRLHLNYMTRTLDWTPGHMDRWNSGGFHSTPVASSPTKWYLAHHGIKSDLLKFLSDKSHLIISGTSVLTRIATWATNALSQMSEVTVKIMTMKN